MNNGARILVVDDEREIRRCLKLSLEERGYTVLAAESGEKAWDLLLKRPPDVAIIDLLLPGIDGIELTKKIRERSTLPIIFLSAIGDDKKKVEALETGADDYVTKPFSIEEVVARIRSVLRRVVGSKNVDPILSFGDLVNDGCVQKGLCLFDSGAVHPNGSFRIHGLAPGRYLYHCELHPIMRGELIVGAPGLEPTEGLGQVAQNQQATK